MLILYGGLRVCLGEKLECQFGVANYYIVGDLYSCEVTSLDNAFNKLTIDGCTGTHLAYKNYTDVKGIWIHDTNTKYIPAGIGILFYLIAFSVVNSQLVAMKSEDFQGMQNLEYLYLANNKLTSVSSDAFATLTQLRYINLRSNLINYMGSGLFDKLTNLNEVYLSGNICVTKLYEGTTAIIQLKHDVKSKCMNPNDPYEIINNLQQEIKELKSQLSKSNDDLKK